MGQVQNTAGGAELSCIIDQAISYACSRRHDSLTTEHLMLVLLDKNPVIEVLKAYGFNVDRLRKNLISYNEADTEHVPFTNPKYDINPNQKFRLVIKGSIDSAFTEAGERDVTAIDVLLEVLKARDVLYKYLLGKQGVSWKEVIEFISDGIKKSEPPEVNREVSIRTVEVSPFKFNPEVMAILVEAQRRAGKGPITRETLAALLAPPIDFPLDSKAACPHGHGTPVEGGWLSG